MMESLIAKAFAKRYGYDQWVKYNPGLGSTPDYLFYKAEVYRGCIEIKRRYRKFAQFVDFLTNHQKITDLLAYDKNGALVLAFDDLYGYLKPFFTPPYKFSTKGRLDRGDPTDMKKVAHFKLGDLIVIGDRDNQYPLERIN